MECRKTPTFGANIVTTKTKALSTTTRTRGFNPAVLLIPIAGLLALGLYAQKTAAGYLNYFVQGVALAFDNITPVLRVNITVQNPSNSKFVVRSIVGTVSANGTVIGNASMFTTVSINPNSQVILPVFVRLSPLAIVSDIVTLIQNGGGISQTIVLEGAVNANNLLAPIKVSYKIL